MMADRKSTRVFVVGDSALSAARVEAMLRGDPLLDVHVVDVKAISTLDTEHQPAVVILIGSSRMVERLARSAHAQTAVIILLTPAPQEAWTTHARRSGVRAVLPLDVTAEELSAAVAATRAGLLVLHPDALSRTKAAWALAEPGTLTARELEVLEMMAEGMSNRAIAARLKISRYTVKFHVAAILTKLAARTRAEAVTIGVRQGLLTL
jgi:two-component system, NarL family, response regulator YdfI